MNCHASSRLYVRANGTVPCNCDTGETTLLFQPDLDDLSSFDYVEDCFNGEPFVRMREKLLMREAPIKACEACFFFHPSETFEKYGNDGRVHEIEHVQIESSFQCGIDCDACVLRSTRTDPALSALGAGPYEMPLDLFRKLIDDIQRAELHVGEMAFCGRGEPLLHPQFTEMMQHARERLPRTFFSVVSSGNAALRAGDPGRRSPGPQYRRGLSGLVRDLPQGRQLGARARHDRVRREEPPPLRSPRGGLRARRSASGTGRPRRVLALHPVRAQRLREGDRARRRSWPRSWASTR